MDKDSITDAADNQSDQQNVDNQSDQGNATTDNQTDADNTGNDNLDSSKSTDSSADDGNTDSNDGDEDTSAPKFDTDLDEWAEKTGRATPTTDRERELYQEIRDGQREFSRTKQAKDATSEVDKALTDLKPVDNKTDDDDEEELDSGDIAQRMIAEERGLRLRGEYFVEKSVTTDEAKTMGEILKEKVERAKSPEARKQAYDYWTHPDQLADWHDLAKARISVNTDTSVIEEEAARKERARIAKESQANGPSRNASQHTEKKTGYNRTEFLKAD